MSGWGIVFLLMVLFGLCELARRLERTRLDVPMRKPEAPRSSNHFHIIGYVVMFPCDDKRCPEWRADR